MKRRVIIQELQGTEYVTLHTMDLETVRNQTVVEMGGKKASVKHIPNLGLWAILPLVFMRIVNALSDREQVNASV